MHVIDIPTMKGIVRDVVVELNEPVMIVGQFGAGKTEGIEQAVEELDTELAASPREFSGVICSGAVLCDIRLGQYDSVDMRGFPGVDRETGMTLWHPPSTLPNIGNPNFPDDKLIILALDELTSATPPVFGVSYQLINERKIGEHTLKPNVRIVAAGNREQDKGIVNRIPMPLANRMTWFEVGVSVDAWCEWAQLHGVPAIFVAFMQFRKPLLCTYDPTKPEKVVATPRTWAKAAKYFSSGMSHDRKMAAMAGAVGEGPTMEFWGFNDIWQKVLPISAIIADPEKVKLPDEPSMRYATAISVSGAMDPKNVTQLYKFLLRLPPEFVVMAWQLAVKRNGALFNVKEFMDFSRRYQAVFDK